MLYRRNAKVNFTCLYSLSANGLENVNRMLKLWLTPRSIRLIDLRSQGTIVMSLNNYHCHIIWCWYFCENLLFVVLFVGVSCFCIRTVYSSDLTDGVITDGRVIGCLFTYSTTTSILFRYTVGDFLNKNL